MILAIEPMVNEGKYKVQNIAGWLDGGYKKMEAYRLILNTR